MRVLTADNVPFDLNNPTIMLSDKKFCIFDYSQKGDEDFYQKKVISFITYRYPVAKISFDYYSVELPLNWKIVVTNAYDQLCRLVAIEDLLHFENQVPIFNPYYVGLPIISNVELVDVNPNLVEHFVPKLAKKNLLVIPLGTELEWKAKYWRYGSKGWKPHCIMACDDSDTSKFEMELSSIIA